MKGWVFTSTAVIFIARPKLDKAQIWGDSKEPPYLHVSEWHKGSGSFNHNSLTLIFANKKKHT